MEDCCQYDFYLCMCAISSLVSSYYQGKCYLRVNSKG